MNRIIPFRNKNSVDDEAYAWLVRLDSGLDPEEKERFLAWLEADRRNVEVFTKAASLWDQMNILGELAEIFPLETYTPVRTRSGFAGKFVLAAAMMIGIVSIGAMAYFEVLENYARATYETAVGEHKTVELPDGSEVIINTDSRVRVSYSFDERGVYLDKGEGHFIVEKNVDRPFRVYVGSRIVEAVGTAFNVQRSEGNDIEVMVTEGVVNLKSVTEEIDSPTIGSEPVEVPANNIQSLVAGDYAAVSADQAEEKIEKVKMLKSEMEAKLAWREGMLLFQGESLDFVVREVSRYTETKIEADQSIKDIVVNGYFRAGDIDGLLVTMQQNFKLDSVVGEKYILLVKGESYAEN